MPPEAFNAWKRHPITHLVIQFLVDKKKVFLFDHLQRWENNRLLPDGGEDERRGICRALEEIATLEIAHIHEFYGFDPKPDDDEAKI